MEPTFKPSHRTIDEKNDNICDSSHFSNADDSLNFQDFIVPPPMNRKEIQPPSYIWERIASVLDEQDRMKILSPAMQPAVAKKIKQKVERKYFYFAAVFMMVGALLFSVA